MVDPVLVATSGDTLAGLEVSEAIKRRLFPLATVITPNVPEASAMLGECHSECGHIVWGIPWLNSCVVHQTLRTLVLTSLPRERMDKCTETWNPRVIGGVGGRAITDLQGMKDAAKALHALGPALVLVKGGHLVGTPGGGICAVDVAYDGHHTQEFSSEIIRCMG